MGNLYIAGLKTGTIYRVIDQSTGITQIKKPNEISVTQSPFSDKIRIETIRNDRHEIHLSVHDVKGINLYQAVIYDANYEFDLSFLPAGTYILTIGIDGKNLVHKLILGK